MSVDASSSGEKYLDQDVEPRSESVASPIPAASSSAGAAGEVPIAPSRQNRAPSSPARPSGRSISTRRAPKFAVPHVSPLHYHRPLVTALASLLVTDLKTWADYKEPQ